MALVVTHTTESPEDVAVVVVPVQGGYAVYWLGQPLTAKPEPDYARAVEVAEWLQALPASERRLWVEARA